MGFAGLGSRLLAGATLQRTRSLLGTRGARAMAVFIGVAYALVAVLVGGMLVLARNDGPHYAIVLWGSGNGTAPWNYPALLVSAGWGSLALPFFPTITMAIVAAGVGIGMAVSVLLTLRLVRQRRGTLGAPTALGSAAGLTPALIALVTLGACCSTTAAATAGLGVIAQASGTSIDQLLENILYLWLFLFAVLWIALIAQEDLFEVYVMLFGFEGLSPRAAPPALTRRRLVGLGIRAVLVGAGVIAALAMFAAWVRIGPMSAPAGTWIEWLLPGEIGGILAISAGLFPRELLSAFGVGPEPGAGWAGRLLAGGAGVAVLAWFPATVVGWGLHGFGNELLGLLGAPDAWGAVPPPTSPVGSLLLRWGADWVVGGWCLAAAGFPDRMGRLLEAAAPSSRSPGSGGTAPNPSGVPSSPARRSGGDAPPALGGPSLAGRAPEPER